MKFGRVHHEEQFCYFILNLDQCSVGLSLTISAILKEGIMGNIHVKLYEIWTNGSGGDVV